MGFFNDRQPKTQDYLSLLPVKILKLYQREIGFESPMTRPLGYFHKCNSHLNSRVYCHQTRSRITHTSLVDQLYLSANCQKLTLDHLILRLVYTRYVLALEL